MDIAGYKDIKKLAEGVDRIVYSGLRESDQRPVVLKTLRSEHPSADMLALMYHEYEMSKDLDFPGLIRTYALIDQHNQYALVQEDMHGISVKEYLQKNPLKELSRFFTLAIPMVQILNELHQRHIIHKDIKPSNFIIQPETGIEKITDLNFSSKLLHEVQDVVPPNRLEGTLDYMAPEQTGRMNMNIDYRSDFYALGVTFYEMLSGQLPFLYTDPLELLHAHLANPVPVVSNAEFKIPEVLVRLVEKLMAKDPADRYQSLIGLLADLERCQKELESTGEIENFILGEQDVLDHLNLSQKLYGREEEAKVLLSAYDRVSNGAVEALMVCGYSGIGKTMLINEIHKPMVRQKGNFISGKFDQLERNTPYTAITQAFNQLARLLLSEPEKRFEAIKKDIMEALGKYGQVIIDLAPDFERVIGQQAPLEKTPPQEMENLRGAAFKRFLRAVASVEHPLVLFIDDLQWVDSGSLKLLEYLLTDDKLGHVLLLGAYRDNEVDEFHPLWLFLKDMEHKRKSIHSLSLPPLTVKDFESLFQDSFNRKDEGVKAFSELVHRRTEGNPFFCKQVIQTLYRKKLLYFDYKKSCWDWSIEAIKELKITDNVIDLMLHKLRELPENTQEILKYAACVGNRFTIETLILVSGQTAESIGKALWSALDQELVLTLRLGYKRVDAMSHEHMAALLSSEITYRFVHDRVQQAVYQSISESEKKAIHLQIARLLLEKEPESCQNERLFEVTDHFNQAHELLKSSEKIMVSELNYTASTRAFNTNAYEPMKMYLESALGLLSENSWKTHYDLTFKINRDYALALCLIKKFEESRAQIKKIMPLVKTNLEKASLYRIQILGYIATIQIAGTFDTTRTALGLLGVKFVPHPSRLYILLKFARLQWFFRRYHVKNLNEELPILTDPSAHAALEILTDLYDSAQEFGFLFAGYVSMVAMELVLRYGKSAQAGEAMMLYGIFLIMLFKNVDAAFQYANFADKIYKEFPSKYFASPCDLLRARVLNQLRYHTKDSEIYYRRAIEAAIESGNLYIENNAKRFFSIVYSFQLAKSLADLIRRAKTIASSDALSMDEVTSVIDSVRILIMESLASEENFYPEEKLHELRQIIKTSDSKYNAIWFDFTVTYYYYFMEFYEKASFYHELWYSNRETMKYGSLFFEILMINALALAKSIPRVGNIKRWRYQRRFRQIMRELKWLSGKCPINFLHYYLFLRGTWERLRGHYQEAIKSFDAAIENAKRGDYYLWIGLGNELAGEMLMEQSQPRFAIDYIREAHYYYERYGMMKKVKSLERRYPQCFREQVKIARGVATEDTVTHHIVTTTTTTSAGLDFMSVIKASQAISGEIVLDKLFEKILHILVENAGAEKVLFLERIKNAWVMVAKLEVQNGEEQFKMLNASLQEFQDVPQTVIQYSLRAKEPVLMDHAAEDSQYRQDPYIMRTQPKSVLCLPVLHQDKVLGVIYLENNLTIGAFTHDRVTVLTTLASQIAISLKNAQHFEEMERVHRRTERFVPKQFLKLILKENVEEIELGDCMEHEITVLFNDIRDFTTHLEKRKPKDAFGFVNRYWEFMAPIIRKHGGYIDQFQGDAVMAIFPTSSDDALQAGKAMLQSLKEFNKKQRELGELEVDIGIGINTGSAMLGIIGESERLESGVISDVTNTAARVESLNKSYHTHFLLSESAVNAMKRRDQHEIRKVDKVILKGRTQPTYLYEVIDWAQQLQGIALGDYLKQFEQAFDCYERGDFTRAKEILDLCKAYYEKDPIINMLKDRCVEYISKGTPPNWDGTLKLEYK